MLYSQGSLKELRAFLSGTCPWLGRGTLPYRLAQRGPELLRLIAEFVLERPSVVVAGHADGTITIFDFNMRASSINTSILASPLITQRKWQWMKNSQSIQGVAVNEVWFVAAARCGNLRVFRTQSYVEEKPLDLGVALPPQAIALAGNTCVLTGKRALFVVDLASRDVQELPLPFAATPCIVIDDSSVFAQRDEMVRFWFKPDAGLLAGALSSRIEGTPKDLRNPHRQMMTGMAVLPKGAALLTASPEEIRCWQLSQGDKAVFEVLWAAAVSNFCHLQQPLESISLCGRTRAEALVLCLGGSSICVVEITVDAVPAKVWTVCKPSETHKLQVAGLQPGGSQFAVIWEGVGWTGCQLSLDVKGERQIDRTGWFPVSGSTVTAFVPTQQLSCLDGKRYLRAAV